ncbi:MAG: hypothetical protein ACT4PT_00035, partial [Methanobacteriota archaeon]
AELEAAARNRRKPETSIWKAFQTALARVRNDAQWGEVIPKSSIPLYFVERYGAANLYCVDLAGFRRAFYTIEGHDVIWLDVVDHVRYDKWFRVRRK